MSFGSRRGNSEANVSDCHKVKACDSFDLFQENTTLYRNYPIQRQSHHRTGRYTSIAEL